MVAGDQDITLTAVGNAYDWRCALCGLPVPNAEASIDHVIPIWAGGPHTWANVQLAHQYCNERRALTTDRTVQYLQSQPLGRRGRWHLRHLLATYQYPGMEAADAALDYPDQVDHTAVKKRPPPWLRQMQREVGYREAAIHTAEEESA